MKHRQYLVYKIFYRLPLPPDERPLLEEPLLLVPEDPEERVLVEGVLVEGV